MIVDGIDAIAELEDFSMKVEKQGFVKEEERAEENEKIAKRPAEERLPEEEPHEEKS